MEGAVIALVFKYIVTLKPDILTKLNLLSESAIERLREAAA
ncbi:hypothetical protein ASZ90_009595 [hydrocarbon metagenome]|uniref:Uncharacterized protein n=1 Tax=hydrocarbon metagenome TaxID=938273 RepID=A0A0W8FK24_9ZZZZ